MKRLSQRKQSQLVEHFHASIGECQQRKLRGRKNNKMFNFKIFNATITIKVVTIDFG